jgi:hypothetical protein
MCDKGIINQIQRRFIFNLIRQKLSASIDDLEVKNTKERPRRIIFFMPSMEWGEVNLLYYSMIARVEGFEVLYLGTSIELDSLGSICNIQDDDVLFFSVNSECTDDEINKVVPFLNENYQPSLKIISGINVPQKLETLKERLSNSRVVDSAGSFRKVVGSRKEDDARG